MTDHLISGRTLGDWRELSRMDHVFDLIVPSELRALIERVAELEAKLSAYENAPTVALLEWPAKSWPNLRLVSGAYATSGTSVELIARPTRKDGE